MPDVRRSVRSAIMPIGAVLLFIAFAAWALASPVGSSPDEDYHLTSTWCGAGTEEGRCEPGDGPGTRTVPESLLLAPCFAFNADTSASCQAGGYRFADDDLVVTSRGNFVGDYPPVFYFFTSLFVGNDISFSVVAMRIANAALFVLLCSATYLASAAGLRRALVGGLAVTLVPLGVFIVPSINPSSWAVLSAGTLLVSVLGFMTAPPGPRRLALAGLAAVAVLLGAGARADAAMYSVIAIGAALILSIRWDRPTVLRALYPVALAIAAAAAYFSVGQSSALVGVAPGSLGPSQIGRLLVEVPELWAGALGKWGLGWLDTTMAPIVWFVGIACVAGAVFAGMASVNLRRGLALTLVGLAMWLVPAYAQYLSGHPVGSYVQPRYILPLVVLFVVTATARTGGELTVWTQPQRLLIVTAISGANAVALHMNIRRYVTGTDAMSLNLDNAVEWWWGFPVSPMGVWFVGAVAFAIAALILTRDLVPPAVAGDGLAASPGANPAPDSVTTGPAAVPVAPLPETVIEDASDRGATYQDDGDPAG